MSLSRCGFEEWRQLLNKEHVKRLFCTRYFSSHMSAERFSLTAVGKAMQVQHIRCFRMVIHAALELSGELLLYGDACFSWGFSF